MQPNLFINGFACLTGDASLEDFAPFLEVRKLRRAEPISKNVLLCALRALQQAQVPPSAREDMGISLAMGAGALGSTIKFMDSIIEDGDELSSPTAFASSVHNSTALMLSMFLQMHGPCVVTGQLDASFAGALVTAQQFLAKHLCEQVLVVVTEDVNPLLQDVLQKDPHVFDPFLYQPTQKAQRVAAAFVLSAAATQHTQFVLHHLQLASTQAVQTQSEVLIPVQSCAHSALLLNHYLQEKKPFHLQEQFAGMLFNVQGEPYVLP